MTSPTEKEEFEWLRRAVARNLGPIQSSRVFLSLLTKDMAEDPLPCLQLGMAILLDKPIAVMALDGVQIPENLRKVAKVIARGSKDDMEGVTRKVVAALTELDAGGISK